MGDAPNWCKDGASQSYCHRYHVRDAVPKPRPSSGQDRECPICGANLAITKADKPEVWMVMHCFGTCDTEHLWTPGSIAIADALIATYGVDRLCLGRFGLEKSISNGSAFQPYRSKADPALLAAAARWYAVEKFPREWTGQIIHLAVQGLRECCGEVPADPYALIPYDYGEFRALAGRAGISRFYVERLFTKWCSYR